MQNTCFCKVKFFKCLRSVCLWGKNKNFEKRLSETGGSFCKIRVFAKSSSLSDRNVYYKRKNKNFEKSCLKPRDLFSKYVFLYCAFIGNLKKVYVMWYSEYSGCK